MPVGLVELLILYARVQFYTPRALDYRLISKTAYDIFYTRQTKLDFGLQYFSALELCP
jgi:hypothetical protein